MKTKLWGILILIITSMLYLAACDNSTNPGLDDSLELYTGLVAVPGASNTTLLVNKGRDLSNDGYFQINVTNTESNVWFENTEVPAWCLEWKKPLRSNNDEHTEVRWFDTSQNNKWKPMNYFLSMRKEFQKNDEELTFREFQAAIWSLAGYMEIAPEFDLTKLSDSELPSDFRTNGVANFNKQKVLDMVSYVLSNYSSAVVSYYGVVGQTADDQQDIITDPEDPSDPEVGIDRIELVPDPAEVRETLTIQMDATVFNEENEIVSCNLDWTIGDGFYASVDGNGLITGINEGQTTVTADCNGISATATVVVTPPPPVIDEDTYIYIYFDSSGSMNSTLNPLVSMRNNLLRDALLPFYNNNGAAYDEQVNVISWSNERTFNVMNLQGAPPPDGNVIVLVFQDEAHSTYHASTSTWSPNSARTFNFNTDITNLRTRLDQFANDFSPEYYRSVIFQVTNTTFSGAESQVGANFKALIQAVENGTGNYAPPYGLSDRNEITYVYDVEDGDSPQAYLDLVVGALQDLGFQL